MADKGLRIPDTDIDHNIEHCCSGFSLQFCCHSAYFYTAGTGICVRFEQ